MNRLLVSSFVLGLLISISVAFAAGVDVTLSKENVVGYTTETQIVDVIVKNTQGKTDTFTLSIFPTQFEKVTASLESFLLTLGPNEEKEINLYLTVAINADLISPAFTVTAKSTSDESVTASKTLILVIQRKTPVYISDLSLENYAFNPGEQVKIFANVFNLDESMSAKNFLKITVKKGTNVVKTFDESLDSIGAKSSVDVSEAFTLDKYAASGSYVIEAELKDSLGQLKYSKSINFNVNTITQPPTEYTKKTSSYNIIFSTVSIKIKNEGNIELPAFSVTESVPKFVQSLFDPDIEPTSISSDGRVVYIWSVPSLPPEGQYTIIYKIAIWRIWLTLALIGGIGYGAYKWLSRPQIGKLTRHEGEITKGKEILVLLEVKNRSLHEIKNIEVVDVVPPIARVVDRFDTLRPKARRVPDGIELRWNLDAMKSGEERVVTYRIRPIMDIVGHLNLPEAQMVFLDRNKVKRMSASKQALVKAG